MSDEFEPVLTMTDYWDGPKQGIAVWKGEHWYYERGWDQKADDYTDDYLLTPVDDEIVTLALESWAIWRRWEAAYHRGETGKETHPALPEDRQRNDVLAATLATRLVTDPDRAVRRRAEFRERKGAEWSGYGRPPLEARWYERSVE